MENNGITAVFQMHHVLYDSSFHPAVLGSCKELGYWNPERAIIAKPASQNHNEWKVEVVLPLWYNGIDYKWIIINTSNKGVIEWETGPNRKLPLRERSVHVRMAFNGRASIYIQSTFPFRGVDAGNSLLVKANEPSFQRTVEKNPLQTQRFMEQIHMYVDHGLNVKVSFHNMEPSNDEADGTDVDAAFALSEFPSAVDDADNARTNRKSRKSYKRSNVTNHHVPYNLSQNSMRSESRLVRRVGNMADFHVTSRGPEGDCDTGSCTNTDCVRVGCSRYCRKFTLIKLVTGLGISAVAYAIYVANY